MGGSIRKDMNHKATHLICPQAFGDKYRYALTFRLNVVRSSWVLEAWDRRNEEGFTARNDKYTIDHKLKIFENCRVAFIGFPEHERVNMSNLLRSYNGIETTSDDETCTHKVSIIKIYCLSNIVLSLNVHLKSSFLDKLHFSCFCNTNFKFVYLYVSNILHAHHHLHT